MNMADLHPHSAESECAVLGSVLLSPPILPTVSGRLAEEDFYLERHQQIFSAMLELQADEVEVDMRTLQATLQRRGTFEAVGGLAYLAELDLDLPDLGRIERYVEIVKDCSLRRQLIAGFNDLVKSSANRGGSKAAEVIAKAERLVSDLGQETSRRGLRSAAEGTSEVLAMLQERSGGVIGLPTGYYDWDAMTQGLGKENLIVLAGRPGMGKTSFAINVAQHVAIREQEPVAVFSLEMSQSELLMRVMASETPLPFARLRSGDLSQNEWSRLYDATRLINESPLYIDDTPSPSLLEVGSKARRLQAKEGLSLLVVDYLQLMQLDGKRYENRNLELSAITRYLKQLAKELEVPIILLSQLSRKCEDRQDHRPRLADLRESGAIEQDADMVCFLYRDEVYNKDSPENKGLAELIVAKHRNGETGTVRLVFDGWRTTFANLSTREAAA